MAALDDIVIVTRNELRAAGFTEEQINELEKLRQYYPHIEYLDSRREWHRLRLMKWMIQERETASEETKSRSSTR